MPEYPTHDIENLTGTEAEEFASIPEVATALDGLVNDPESQSRYVAELARLVSLYGKGMLGNS